MVSSRGVQDLAVCWTFTGLAAIVVFLRILLRTKLSSTSGRDDVVIVICLLLSLAYSSITTAAVAYGAGEHEYDIPADQISTALELLTITPVIACLAFSLPKLSVIFLIHRVFEPPKLHLAVLYTLFSLVLTAAIIDFIMVFVQCSPPQAMWEPWLWEEPPYPDCWSPSVNIDFSIFTGALSAFVDFVLALYPVSRLARLRTSRQRKITISVLFSLGIVAGIVAIVKCVNLPSLAQVQDLSYATSNLVTWSTIETNVLIIAACIPTLSPLFSRERFSRWRGSRQTGPPAQSDKYDKNGYPKNLQSGSGAKRTISVDTSGESDSLYGILSTPAGNEGEYREEYAMTDVENADGVAAEHVKQESDHSVDGAEASGKPPTDTDKIDKELR